MCRLQVAPDCTLRTLWIYGAGSGVAFVVLDIPGTCLALIRLPPSVVCVSRPGSWVVWLPGSRTPSSLPPPAPLFTSLYRPGSSTESTQQVLRITYVARVVFAAGPHTLYPSPFCVRLHLTIAALDALADPGGWRSRVLAVIFLSEPLRLAADGSGGGCRLRCGRRCGCVWNCDRLGGWVPPCVCTSVACLHPVVRLRFCLHVVHVRIILLVMKVAWGGVAWAGLGVRVQGGCVLGPTWIVAHWCCKWCGRGCRCVLCDGVHIVCVCG